MNRQQLTRRIVLGAFAVALALPGLRAAATVEGPMDFGSRQDFADYCENVGGDLTDTGDGNLWCQSSEETGSQQTVCDSDGNDCYTIFKTQEPARPWDPHTPTVREPTTEIGNTAPSAPVVDSPTAPSAQPSVAAPDDEQDQDQDKRKGKGKKAKKGGKGRKK